MVKDNDVVEWKFEGNDATEPARVRLREGDPKLPANKAMLLGCAPGLHTTVRLTDLEDTKKTTFPGDPKDTPALLMRANNKVEGTLYGETRWLWSTENKYQTMLFAGVHLVGNTAALKFGEQVSLDSDKFHANLGKPLPRRYLVLITQSCENGQARFSAVLYNQPEENLVHVGLSHISAVVPRVCIDISQHDKMRAALLALTLGSPKSACMHAPLDPPSFLSCATHRPHLAILLSPVTLR